MGAVVNITEYGNAVTIGNALAAVMAPAFVKSNCAMNLIYTEGLPVGANTKKFIKRGSLTAAPLAESTALAPDANGELTDTSVTATIAKAAVVSGLSVEAEQFTNITLDRLAEEHGAAIGRYVDNDLLGLASGLSVSVTSASVGTVDDLMLAQFNIYNSETPNKEVMLQAILNPKYHYNIKKEMIQAGASAWANQTFLEVLQTTPKQNCYVGSIPGLADFYATTGFGTSGGDTYSMIFHPMWCFAGCFAPAPVTWIKPKGAEGFYTEVATYFMYDVLEWNDAAGVGLLSDT